MRATKLRDVFSSRIGLDERSGLARGFFCATDRNKLILRRLGAAIPRLVQARERAGPVFAFGGTRRFGELPLALRLHPRPAMPEPPIARRSASATGLAFRCARRSAASRKPRHPRRVPVLPRIIERCGIKSANATLDFVKLKNPRAFRNQQAYRELDRRYIFHQTLRANTSSRSR